MNAYFETSAIVKLLIDEAGSEIAADLWDAADRHLTSRITYAEGCAALAAAKRLGRLSSAAYRHSKTALKHCFGQMYVIEVDSALGLLAGELAEHHALRGYDAVHLASAISLENSDAIFVSWDSELVRAALQVGLPTAGEKASRCR